MHLLVAALSSELQAFPAHIPGWDRLITGPGKLLAAVGLSERLGRGDVDSVLVLGTAGAVTAGTTGIHEIAAAIQHDVTDLEGVRGRHVALPERVSLPVEGVTIATGDSFVSDAAYGQMVRGLGASLVDMESYAYAWAAQRAGVPIRIVKVVSDSADEGSETLWDRVVARCSADLWRWFQDEYLQ